MNENEKFVKLCAEAVTARKKLTLAALTYGKEPNAVNQVDLLVSAIDYHVVVDKLARMYGAEIISTQFTRSFIDDLIAWRYGQ